MKTKASILTKLTIGVLIAGSIAACNQNKTAGTTAPAAASGTSGSGIVFVNQDTLSLKYQYADDMRKRLEDKGKTAQSDLGGRKQAFQREVAEYQRGAATLSADQRSTTEQRLQREGQEMQTYEQNATAQFQNEQAGEQQKLYERVYNYAKQFAAEKGYKMVLTFSNGSTQLLYGDKSMDVTTDFLKGLNDAYAKEKK